MFAKKSPGFNQKPRDNLCREAMGGGYCKMRFRRKNGIIYLTFANLEQFPELTHAVFTRLGGASTPPFDSLNIAGNSGDDPSAVLQNRRTIAGCLGGANMYYLSQVHGIHIVIPDTNDLNPPEADGAITDKTGIMLVVQAADCQSVLIYDSKNKVVANLHAGWKGSTGNIIGKCIGIMKSRFNSEPESVLAAIGPSLGPCCAEFINYKKEIPKQFLQYKDEKNRFNFWQISHDQLTEGGVPAENIEWANICTKCNTHLFFSYRHANETGRFASVAGLF